MSRDASPPIKVLVVEDTRVVREMLLALFNADPGLQVVGAVNDGAEALAAVEQLQPDVITMDVQMPRMGGFAATRQIMECCPKPIVIVSGNSDAQEVQITFQALEAGAMAMVARPVGPGHPRFEAETRELIRLIKAMSEVKVVRRWAKGDGLAKVPTNVKMDHAPRAIRLVAMGGSTGAPLVLKTILSELPKDFPVPVAIVQHMTAGFIGGFAEWLQGVVGYPVELARNGQTPRPGHAYLAPDGFHMGVCRQGLLKLELGTTDSGLRPSVAHLFRTAAATHGRGVAAVLLSGMGADGALELKQLRDLGALTFAQNRATSVVFGMPGVAVNLGAAQYILSPEEIAHVLVQTVKSLSLPSKPASQEGASGA